LINVYFNHNILIRLLLKIAEPADNLQSKSMDSPPVA